MCRLERSEKKGVVIGMGLKALSASRVEKLKSSMVTSRSRMKLWMIRATTSVLLWTCIVQLTALGDMWGPRVLKGWPSCFTQDSSAAAAALDDKLAWSAPPRVLPPKSEFRNFSISFMTRITMNFNCFTCEEQPTFCSRFGN